MELPSVVQQAANFVQSAVAHVANGMQHVDEETQKKRLAACESCPNRVEKRCGLCGCVLERKARWASSDCPDKPSRWSLL